MARIPRQNAEVVNYATEPELAVPIQREMATRIKRLSVLIREQHAVKPVNARLAPIAVLSPVQRPNVAPLHVTVQAPLLVRSRLCAMEPEAAQVRAQRIAMAIDAINFSQDVSQVASARTQPET